jgi:DUF971 family protein
MSEIAWPTELRVNPDRNTLRVTFDNGDSFALAAEYLRVESPSAEVQGHGQGQKKLVTGKDAIKIAKLEPVGNYAVRILFDDGHDTGLFSWDYLHELGRDHNKKWALYREAVRSSGG